VSGHDPNFTSKFWTELFRLAGVKLNLSSAFHSQSDGQSEVTNKIIVMYLHCLTGDRPRQWLRLLPWAEYCLNTLFQTSLKTTPFKVVYGRDPLVLRFYTDGESRLPVVQQLLYDRDEFLAEVMDSLEQAQQYRKLHYDRKHREVEFIVGPWVWLRLLHRPIASLQVQGRGKLGPRYFGPYQILQCVGTVAYRVQVPANARLHDVFHVGLLKPYHGDPPEALPALPSTMHGRACLEPEKLLKARVCRGIHELLVQWKGAAAVEASWMPLADFQKTYPDHQLEDELTRKGGKEMSVGASLIGTGVLHKGHQRHPT
jgi:hypothetical protein